MPKSSAGLLLHHHDPGGALVVLLVHPGGPFWARRDEGAWSIPKGEYDEGEDPRQVAGREFAEELGVEAPAGLERYLGEIRQRGGKRVRAWSVAGRIDATRAVSNTVDMEWPRGSGRTITFPEVDRAEWFDVPTARLKLLAAQVPLLDELERSEDSDALPPRPDRLDRPPEESS